MKDAKRKNLLLVSAFLLPVLLFFAVVASIHLSSVPKFTDYNFIYAGCSADPSSSHSCEGWIDLAYYIKDNKLYDDGYLYFLDKSLHPEPDPKDYKINFFLYDTLSDTSRELTSKELYSLKLIDGLVSPDGAYFIKKGKNNLFGNFDRYEYYLKNQENYHSKKINVLYIDHGRYYSGRVYLIGWVLPDKN